MPNATYSCLLVAFHGEYPCESNQTPSKAQTLAASVRAVPARDLSNDDADQLRRLISACRAYAAPAAFPALADVASLLTDPDLASKGALWQGNEAAAAADWAVR